MKYIVAVRSEGKTEIFEFKTKLDSVLFIEDVTILGPLDVEVITTVIDE